MKPWAASVIAFRPCAVAVVNDKRAIWREERRYASRVVAAPRFCVSRGELAKLDCSVGTHVSVSTRVVNLDVCRTPANTPSVRECEAHPTSAFIHNQTSRSRSTAFELARGNLD